MIKGIKILKIENLQKIKKNIEENHFQKKVLMIIIVSIIFLYLIYFIITQ